MGKTANPFAYLSPFTWHSALSGFLFASANSLCHTVMRLKFEPLSSEMTR